MSRRFIYALVAVLFLFVFIPFTNAEDAITESALNTTGSIRQQIRTLNDDKKTAIANIKDDAKASISAQREEFKIKLQVIKDQRKKLLVERIDARIAEVNKNQTTRFTDNLNKLQTFLDRFSKLATGTAALADITKAQTAINTARNAVDAQAAKTYTITITDDLTLKFNAGKTMSQFRLDLVAVHKLVIDAKQAVQKLNTDRKLIKKEKEATESAE